VFRPLTNNRTKELDRPLNPNSIYRNIVLKYGRAIGVSAEVNGLCLHPLRATAATNALSQEADVAKVQEWLGTPRPPRRGSTIGARCGRMTARRSGSGIRPFSSNSPHNRTLSIFRVADFGLLRDKPCWLPFHTLYSQFQSSSD